MEFLFIENRYILIHILLKLVPYGLIDKKLALDQPVRCQAITRTNDNTVQWRTYESLSLNELYTILSIINHRHLNSQ